jgi:hypothetical protein
LTRRDPPTSEVRKAERASHVGYATIRSAKTEVVEEDIIEGKGCERRKDVCV